MENVRLIEQEEEQNVLSSVINSEAVETIDDLEEYNEEYKNLHPTGVLLLPLEEVTTIDQEMKEKQNLFQLNYKKITEEVSTVKEKETGMQKEFISSIEDLINWMNSRFNKILINHELLKPVELNWTSNLLQKIQGISIEIQKVEVMLEGVEESRKKTHDESTTFATRNNNSGLLTSSPNSSTANFNNNNNNGNDTSSTNPTATSLHNTPVITNVASKTSLASSASSSSSMIADEGITVTSIVFSSSLLDEWYTKVVAADELLKHEVYEQVKELINFYQHEKFRAPIDLVNHVTEIVNHVIPLLSDKIYYIRQTLSQDRHIGRWFDGSNESDKWISDTFRRVKQFEVPDLINKYDWTDEKQNIENMIQDRRRIIYGIKQDILQFENERLKDLERKSNDLHSIMLNHQPSSNSPDPASPIATSATTTTTSSVSSNNSSIIIQNSQEDLLVIELMEKQLKSLKEKLTKLKKFIDNILLQTNVESFLMIIDILENLQNLRNEITQIRKSIIEHNDANMVKDDVINVEEKIKNFEKQLPHKTESSENSNDNNNNNTPTMNTTTTTTKKTNTTSPGLVKALKNKHKKLLLTIQNIKIALAENKLQMAAYLSPSSPSSPTSANSEFDKLANIIEQKLENFYTRLSSPPTYMLDCNTNNSGIDNDTDHDCTNDKNNEEGIEEVEPEQVHGLTCNDDHVEEWSERYNKIESELILFERSLWVEFWLKSEPAKRLRGEEVIGRINKAEKTFADIKDLMILRQNNLQTIREGRKFAKSANAIRDQLDIIKGKMRRQDTKTDASIQELDAHMADALEMLNNLESAYQHLIAPDVGDERYRERFDEQLNQFNLVEAWIKEVKIWFKEAERMRVWIDKHIVVLENFPKFDALQEGKVPATQEQVDEWQDDYDKLELEVEKFDAEDMTRLRAHINEAISNDLSVLALRVDWEREFAKALNTWNILINSIKDFIINRGRWKQPIGIRDDDGWFINANQPNQKDVLIELESINQYVISFESVNIPETGQIFDELVETSLVEVPEHLLIRQENLEESDLVFLKLYFEFCRNVLQQRQEVLEYAQVSETTYIDGLKLKNELIEEERNPRGGLIEKKFIERVEEFNKNIEQAWSNIGEKVIYPDHSDHDQNENHLVKEGVDAYHRKMEDLKFKVNKAMKDYQDAFRLLEKELQQKSDDLFNDISNLEDLVNKRLAMLEERKIDPLETECLHNEEQVKELLKEHEEFLAENNRIDLEDINQIKEGIEKLVEDIKSSNNDDPVDQIHLHDAFKKLNEKFAELQLKTSERQLDLSVLQPCASWEDKIAPGMQSLNDLINEVNKFIAEKARWKPDDHDNNSTTPVDILTNDDGKVDNLGKVASNENKVTNDSTTISTIDDKTAKEPKLDSKQKSHSLEENTGKDDKPTSTEKNISSDEEGASLNVNKPIPEETKLDLKQEFETLAGKVKDFQENVLEPLKSSNEDMVSAIKDLLSKECPKHLSDRQSDFEKKFDYLMDRVNQGKNVLEQHDAINDFLKQAKGIIDWVNPHLKVLDDILKDDTLGELSEDKLHDLLEEVNFVESEQKAYTDFYEQVKNLANDLVNQMNKEIAANNNNNSDGDIDLGIEALNSKEVEIDALWQELQDTIPKTKQQLDQALQVVDFKERIKENFSKVDNLSDIISSSLVDEVSKDDIKDWQIELNGLEQTELFSLIKLHDNVKESLSTNLGAITKKESVVLEDLLRNVADKINNLKKLMNNKIDEVEAHISAQITGEYLARVNDLQSWIERQFEDFINGQSQHGIMVETSEQTNKENLENLSIVFDNFQKKLPEKFEQFNSIIEEFNNITSQEDIRELQDVVKAQTELNKLWENLDLKSNEFKDFINKVGKWHDQHDIIYHVENDIFDGLENCINKLPSTHYDNLEFEAKGLDDKLQNAKKMLEAAKFGAGQIVDVENDILDNTNRQNFNKHLFDITTQLTELSNLFQKAIEKANNASLLTTFDADVDKIINACLEDASKVESRHNEFNDSEYYSLKASELNDLINNAMIGVSDIEGTLKKYEAQINVNLKAEADKLIKMDPEANKDRVQSILNKATRALENFSNSISAERCEIETAKKIYPQTEASEDIKKWISACKVAALNIQVGDMDQEAEIKELEENAMTFQPTIDAYKDMSQRVILPIIVNDTNATSNNNVEIEPKIKYAVEARTNKVLEDWDSLTDLLKSLRSSLNASKEVQEVSKAIKDILASIDQVKERVLNIESFFIDEGVPKLPTKDDVENNLRELDEIQAEVDHILGPRIEALDENINNLPEHETSFVQQRSGIAEILTNLAGIMDNKRSQLHEAEKLAIFGTKADEMNTLMSSLLEIVDLATTTMDGSPLSSLNKIELDARSIELEKQYSHYQPKIDQKLEDVKQVSESVKDDWRVIDRLSILKEQWAELTEVTNAKQDELKKLPSEEQNIKTERRTRSNSQTLSPHRNFSPTRKRSLSARPPSPRKRGAVSPGLSPGPRHRQSNRLTPSPTSGLLGSPKKPATRLSPHIVNNYLPDPKVQLDVEVARIVNASPVKIKVSVVERESGKYMFGEAEPKLCHCRILKSRMVMVRVGGGWAELSK
ncbi:8969_t:CDS:2 [Entrophospora sp. SA101]|nr:8969_t:CDS:2 [Entrophospora sp. SA101]